MRVDLNHLLPAERAYAIRAEKHTSKNDMKRFLSAVRDRFPVQEIKEIRQNMCVCTEDGDFHVYSLGSSTWYSKREVGL